MTPEATAIQFALKEIDNHVAASARLLDLIGDRDICRSCKGEGAVKEWIAADETVSANCKTCKGSGVVREKRS